MAVDYEWVVEQVTADEVEDIEDVDHFDSYAEAAARKPYDRCFVRVGVVRDEFDKHGVLIDRVWAYLTDGKLPEVFEDSCGSYTSIKVPKRFHAEVARCS